MILNIDNVDTLDSTAITDLYTDGTFTSTVYDNTQNMIDTIEKQNKDIEILKTIIMDLIKDDRPDLLLKYMDIFKLD